MILFLFTEILMSFTVYVTWTVQSSEHVNLQWFKGKNKNQVVVFKIIRLINQKTPFLFHIAAEHGNIISKTRAC